MSNAYRSSLAGGGAAVGDATAADVLTGKTFSGAVGSGVSGTMPNNGAVSQTIGAGESYTIPAGYHNGSGTVTASAPTLTEIDAKNSANKPNLITTTTTGEGVHRFVLVIATVNTNITSTDPSDIHIKFNNVAVTPTQLTFVDESAHDLYVATFEVTGAGSVEAGFGTTSDSGKTSMVALYSIT